MADPTPPGNNPGPNGAAEPVTPSGFLSIQEAVDLHVAQSQPPAEPAAPPETPPVPSAEAIGLGSPDNAGTPAPAEPPIPETPPEGPQPETFPKLEPEAPPAEPVAPAEAPLVGLPEVRIEGSPGEPPQTPPAAAAFAFEHDGKQITVDEAQKGYQRFSDYTRKTQELAEQRAAAEANALAITTERQQYTQNLTYLNSQLEALKGLDNSTNWDQLEQDDPIGFLQAKERQRSVDDYMTQVGREQERLAAVTQTEVDKTRQQNIQTEQTALMEAMPSWTDPKIASDDRTKISQYLQLKGVSEQEMAGIYDHRLITIFADAVIGHALKDKTPLAAKKVVKAKPGLQPSGAPAPGAGQSARVTAANKRLTETGSLDDAVNLHMEMQRG